MQSLHILNVCPFDISVGVGAFVIGLSQISSFLSLDYTTVRCFKVVLMKRKPHLSGDLSFHHRPVKKRRGEGFT